MPLAGVPPLVELGLVVLAGRRCRWLGERRAARRSGAEEVADHGPGTAPPPPPHEPRDGRRLRRLPPPLLGIGISGIHGRLWARPIARADDQGGGDAHEQEHDALLVALAEELQHLDADEDAAEGPAGIPKKNRANGYSAMNTRNTASSSGRTPACGRSTIVPTTGIDGQEQQRDGELRAPEQAFDLPPEVPRWRS